MCFTTVFVLHYAKQPYTFVNLIEATGGWPGGAMVLGKLPVAGRRTNWDIVGQGPTAFAVGAGGVVWTFFLCLLLLSSFSLTLGGGPI